MGTALGAIGMLGFAGFFIWFLILLIARKSTGPAKTGMTVSAILLFVGLLTYVVVEHEPTKQEPDSTSQSNSKQDISSLLDTSNDNVNKDEGEPDRSEDVTKPGPCTLPSGFEITLFYSSVRNDVTGNWRLSAGASSIPISDCALEYYDTMFTSDDEIHAVWNATLGTMASIKAMSGLLFIDTFEYVKGEEHDAKLLFSGMLLDSLILNIETGEPFESE